MGNEWIKNCVEAASTSHPVPSGVTTASSEMLDGLGGGTAVKGRFGKSKPVIEGTAKKMVQGWSYRRTILRQDEIAAFIKSSKGDKYSALLPLLGLGHLEHAAENVRQLRKAVADGGGLKIKTGQLSAAIDARRVSFGDKTDAEIDAIVDGVYTRYVDAGETKPAAQRTRPRWVHCASPRTCSSARAKLGR